MPIQQIAPLARDGLAAALRAGRLAASLVLLLGVPAGADPGERSALVGGDRIWATRSAGGAWEERPLPVRGRVAFLGRDPTGADRLLLIQSGRMWLSHDLGEAWGRARFEGDEETAVAAAFDPSRLDRLVLATSRRVLLSDDLGRHWREAARSPEYRWHPRLILVSAARPELMYLATGGDGFFRSDDGGESWVPARRGLPRGIGAPSVAPIQSAVLDSANPGVVYAALEMRGVYKTTNGGRSWTRASRGLPDQPFHRTQPSLLAMDPDDPRRLLLFTTWPVHSHRIDSAFFLSEDGAKSWRRLSAAAPARAHDLEFSTQPSELAIAVTDDGILRLAD